MHKEGHNYIPTEKGMYTKTIVGSGLLMLFVYGDDDYEEAHRDHRIDYPFVNKSKPFQLLHRQLPLLVKR